MTHYLLSVHGPADRGEFGSYGSQEEMEEAFAATGAFNDKLHADGYWVFAGGLEPATTATVVDGQGETPVLTDGPYLETKEVIGGYSISQCKDKAEAIEWTKRFLQTHEDHWTITAEVREIEEG